MADRRRDPRFIVCRERAHAIAEPLRDESRIFRESVSGVAVDPPVVFALQLGRQIPVVERREGFNVALEQSVNQAVVEIDTGSDDCAGSGRLNSRPGNGEAIPSHAERGDQVEVRLESVVMIASDLSVGAVRDDAGKAAELIPDRVALAVGGRGTLDLKGAAGNTPDKARREALGKLIKRFEIVHLIGCLSVSKEYRDFRRCRFSPCAHYEPWTRGSPAPPGEDHSA